MGVWRERPTFTVSPEFGGTGGTTEGLDALGRLMCRPVGAWSFVGVFCPGPYGPGYNSFAPLGLTANGQRPTAHSNG